VGAVDHRATGLHPRVEEGVVAIAGRRREAQGPQREPRQRLREGIDPEVLHDDDP
jgi:hypothetical protein